MLTFEPHELALATTHVGKKNCLRLMWKKSCLQICTPANTHTKLSLHPGLRIKNGDPSTQTQVRKHECLPLNRMTWRYPQLMWEKIFPSTHVGKILPSNLHSCKHSHIIVCPPKAPDQKWRPFHTDSGAKI